MFKVKIRVPRIYCTRSVHLHTLSLENIPSAINYAESPLPATSHSSIDRLFILSQLHAGLCRGELPCSNLSLEQLVNLLVRSTGDFWNSEEDSNPAKKTESEE